MCRTEFATGLPGGYCVDECDASGGCTEGWCVTVGGVNVCAADCGAATDCRPGYTCVDLTDFSVCWGQCDDDAQCTSTGHCDAYPAASGFCSCPTGEHLNPDATDCVYDTCTDLDCPASHRSCNATGGCSGACAACDACDPATYIESTNHCYPPGAVWGGPCEVDADCPGSGTPGMDTFCDPSGGGNCYQSNGPDFAAEGSPCNGDAGSVGVTLFDMFGTPYLMCAQDCSTDADCPAGLACETGGESGTVQYCWAILDCATSGCNDPGSTLYCSAAGACYENGCLPTNPCTTVANSTGVCQNDANDFRCACDDGFIWNPETGTCDTFTCPATTIAPGGSSGSLDLCTGTTDYDAAGSGSTCTGYSSSAQEMLFRLAVPASSMVTITMDATTFDASLWVTTDCTDQLGASCVVGADAETTAAEVVTLLNFETTPTTFIVVADSYEGCGTFTLSVSAATPVPCGDGTIDTSTAEQCDDGNTTPGDGCSNSCEVEFGWSCDNSVMPSVCTSVPSLGTFAPAETIPPQTGGPLAGGAAVAYGITFSAAVLLDGAALATAGNPDITITNAGGTVATHAATGTAEGWTGDSLAAGAYVLTVRATGATAIPSFTLTLTTTAP
ncbi:MAG: hypothetical protein HY905_04425 [Deltaproteobacteria bacterium]|nr:hypothetical protein [Deltaproteobacteria bacterium]